MESINNEDKTLIHISHLHPLKLIESPEPIPLCHACNMLCSNQSYGCIQCYYFLHVTCATTKRTMDHISNEDKTLIHISHLHPLKLIESPEPLPMCHACNMLCSNQSYGCIQCYYFLHITCATTKRTMDHPSHPAHTLKLELTPPYHSGYYGCDGCGVGGTSFCLRCGECSYDLHLPCAAIPHQVKHSSHHHQLTLVYENPYSPNMEFSCDLCMKYLDVNKWFYLCTSCNFGGHVGCFSADELEVLSPGLQATHAQPPPEQTQPQPPPEQTQPQPESHGTANDSNEETILQQQHDQFMRTQVEMMKFQLEMSQLQAITDAMRINFLI